MQFSPVNQTPDKILNKKAPQFGTNLAAIFMQ
jgi:hypothetical protein